MPEPYAVDLVFPWVDGNDPAWQKEKANYLVSDAEDARALRYRHWDTLRFLFRGVEENLPWVRRVFFVTWGHLPPWLNTQCPKLTVVNHRDYIPARYLPTFNANTIELNLHRIEGLSEQFIYANDDTFFLRPLPPEFFFRGGLPVDRAEQNVLQFARQDGIDRIVANDLMVINTHFSKRETIRRDPAKWFSPKYGAGTVKNLYLTAFSNFTGFRDPHQPNALLKSTLREVWTAEAALLDATCLHRFRSNEDVNQWLFRYWQLAAGKFFPGNGNRGAFFPIGRNDEAIRAAILNGTVPMLCLSDDDETVDFTAENKKLCAWFSRRFPNKSAFEQ